MEKTASPASETRPAPPSTVYTPELYTSFPLASQTSELHASLTFCVQVLYLRKHVAILTKQAQGENKIKQNISNAKISNVLVHPPVKRPSHESRAL